MAPKPAGKKPDQSKPPTKPAPPKAVAGKVASEPPNPTPPEAEVTDWERIELDYRAGVKSLREMAKGSGVSHVTISKRATAEGWVRDLKAKIQAKADELVNKALVNRPVNTVNAVSERETIDANAQAVADVKIGQRRDIQRSRKIVMSLLDELELQTGRDTVILLEQLGDMLRKEDDKGMDRLNDLYQKIISLPGRAKTMKDLGESLRVLVGLERQAFGLDDKDNAPVDALTSLLHSISKTTTSAFKPVTADPDHDEG